MSTNVISLLDKLDKYFKPLIKKIEEAINEHGTDYTLFSKEQKQATAAAASLAKAIKTVLDTPILDEDGNMTYESDLVLRNVKPDEIVHGTCSEQNSSKQATIKELNVNDIITQCEYNIEYRPNFYDSDEKEEYADINIDLLVKLMNYSYGLQATKEEYVSAISIFNTEDKYRVLSLQWDLTRFIETCQIALIVEECIIHFTSELRIEDIDWDKLIYKIKTIYKVRMEKWQLFTPGKNTIEIVMKRIHDKITNSQQPTIFVKSEFQRLDRL